MMNSRQAKLAINGGSKAVSSAFNARYHFTEAEKEACNRVLDAAIQSGTAPGYGGEEEEAFCREFAQLLSVQPGYADAVSSGSAAVFVALRALTLPAFSEVIVAPFTDPGGIMPVVMANCIPIIADAEAGSFNMSLASIKELVTERTRAILVAHIAGEPADMPAICAFAREKGLAVVEDCAQAHGAHIDGQLLGTFGDVAAFSLMFGKHICCGGQGGMVYTQSEELYWKIRRHSDRGKPFGLPEAASNSLASLNFNMDEIHCAIGRVQLQKALTIAAGRQKVARQIMAGLADLPMLRELPLPPKAVSSVWFLRLLFDFSRISCDKETFCAALAAEGLPNSGSYALPFLSDWYQQRQVFPTTEYPWSAPEYKGDREKIFSEKDIPRALKAMHDTVLIHPHENWSDANIAQAIDAIRKVCLAYAR